jgi:hypothetical protein
MSSLFFIRHKVPCVCAKGVACFIEEKLSVPPRDVTMKHWRVRSSVADLCHFGVDLDPDPWIHASD